MKISSTSIRIDLNQFKLHLNLPDQKVLSLHFDTPSRRFYLSVIALVVEQMKKDGRISSIPLEDHADLLVLLNETVGRGAGSSKKEKLLSRIYRKWKDALPDLENAPLFKVIGRKKVYDDTSRKTYRFDSKTKDAWANLFEYKGSGEKVRLRFSAERFGVELEDVLVVYGDRSNTGEGTAWDRFVEHLRNDVKGRVQTEDGRTAKEQDAPGYGPEVTPVGDEGNDRDGEWKSKPFPEPVDLRYTGGDGLNDWLEKQGGIEKIPMKTRLEMIAQLAIALSAAHDSEGQYEDLKSGKSSAQSDDSDSSRIPLTDSGISLLIHEGVPEILIENISKGGNDNMLYTAPELLDGRPPSPRSDVYSLGVLLYQLVVGDISRPLDPDWKQAVSDDILREDIAMCVERLPENRLAHPVELSERLRKLDERRRFLELENPAEKSEQDTLLLNKRKKRWLVYGSALIIILGLITVFGIRQHSMSQAQAARQSAYKMALPKIRQLLEKENYVEAYSLAKDTEKNIPNDPTLARYIKDATNTLNIVTTPPGAKVSYRPYNDLKGPWIDLGITPIQGVAVPVGMHRFKIQKERYEDRHLVRAVVLRDGFSKEYMGVLRPLYGNPFQFDLYEKGRVPPGMIAVDRGRFLVAIKGLTVKTTGDVLDRFLIDETEVTNRAYKEFIDAGGYAEPKYWKQEFKKDGQVIPWDEAMKAFVDRTGQPGPSTWEFEDYFQGRDDYPVSGLSWFEAAAYAEFRGKSLPTIYHWARAAFPIDEIHAPLTPYLIPQSNIEGTGLAEAGSFPGIGSSGAKDMAGNVREWCWNGLGEQRYCLGGMWRDPAYMFNESFAPSAWDRSSDNGFRCALYPNDAPVPEKFLKEAYLGFHDPYSIPAYSDEAMQAMKAMYEYERTPFRPIIESKKKGGKGWRRETVTIDAAYNSERLIIHLDLPTSCAPPYKTVIYYPGGSALLQPTFSRSFLWEPWDLLPKNGRAFICPIYSGTYERGGDDPDKWRKKNGAQWRFEWLNDLRRTIDYLETREDIDTKNIVFMGVSWGSFMCPMLSPFEERIKGLILVSGCIYTPGMRPKPKGLEQPHVTIPVLMLNGKYDYAWPVKTHQKPLFDLLGTPPEHKKHVIYESGHLPLPRAPMMKEIFAFLDKYQGPVNCDEKPR